MSSLLLGFAAAAIGLFFLLRKRHRYNLPPGPAGLPLLGNLLQIDLKQPHETMRAWGKEFGGIFTVWFGPVPSIVMTDYSVIKEALLGQAENFADRGPNFLFEHFVGYLGIINTSGAPWREQRRFALHTLRDFGFGRKEMETKIHDQIQAMLANIRSDREATGASEEMNLAPHIELCSGNIIAALVLGHIFNREDGKLEHFRRVIAEQFRTLAGPGSLALNSFPWLRHIPLLATALDYYKIKEEQDQIDDFAKAELAACKAAWEADPSDESCYAYAFYAEMEKRRKAGDEASFSERMLLYTTQDLFIAGMETTVTTLKWAFLLLVHNPEVEAKLQAELEEVVGREALLSLDDRTRLPYFMATLNEIQRRANIVPFNLPHSAVQDTKVRGFDVPAGWLVQPEISAVLADPKIFPDPKRFDPTRFLDKKREELVPFSLGKRSCLGESLARAELFLILGSLLQAYRIRPADAENLPSLEPVLGITLSPLPYTVKLEKA